MGSRLLGQHILSAEQFMKKDLRQIFTLAHELRRLDQRRKRKRLAKILRGFRITNLFYEPSTRTASSFYMAARTLGATVDQIVGVHYSSVAKGEVLEDTVRTHAAYSDALILRHKEEGAAARASRVLQIPLLNAGDGVGEHPTQALLDLFTIEQRLGGFDGLTIALVGDLRRGRTIHALCYLLAKFKVRILLVSPDGLALPPQYREHLRERRILASTVGLEQALVESDVVYMTRVQSERATTDVERASERAFASSYAMTPELLASAKRRAILMHPFPRNEEIPLSVDLDPRAAYFDQIRNGLYVRMALLALVLGAEV